MVKQPKLLNQRLSESELDLVFDDLDWVEPTYIKEVARRATQGFEGFEKDPLLKGFWRLLEYFEDKCLQVKLLWGAHLVVKKKPTLGWVLFEANLRQFMDSFGEQFGDEGKVMYDRLPNGEGFRIWIPWMSRSAVLAGRGVKSLVEGVRGSVKEWPIAISWDGNLELQVTPASGEFGERVLREEIRCTFDGLASWTLNRQSENVMVLRVWGLGAEAVDLFQIVAHEARVSDGTASE